MKMRSSIAAVLMMGTLTAIAAHADDKGKGSSFIKEAIQGNLSEVKVGKLAQEKGASEGVKTFGAHLERDHAQANKNAMEAAQSMGVTPPTEPNKQQREIYDKLSKLSGAEFDKEFVKDMVKDHKKDVHEYTEHSKSTDAVGTYAKATLPHLKQHLQEAESLQGNMQASDR